MLGREDHGFVEIRAIALNAAISGSILAEPEACFVIMMALPLGSTRALATAQDISHPRTVGARWIGSGFGRRATGSLTPPDARTRRQVNCPVCRALWQDRRGRTRDEVPCPSVDVR